MSNNGFLYHCARVIAKSSVSVFNKPRVLLDFINLYHKKGLASDEYLNFEFYKREKPFRDSFLGLNEQRYYLDFLNPKKYYILARNKYLAHRVLEHTGIRKSTLYCYYSPEGMFPMADDIASDCASVCGILKRKQVNSCVIKTTESSHGDNVIVVKAIEFVDNDCIMHLFNGAEKRLSEILGKEPLIFEAIVKQTTQFSSFNASSVNTVRFMTTLYPNGEAKVIATFIKIGRAGKCVDNAGGGGNVDVGVNHETGEIKYPIQFDGWGKIKDIEKHPDSGTQLNGVMIENWNAIKQEVIRFQQAMPFCKAIGWDIAITDEGPVVIEVNEMWDRTGQYFIRKGWRNEVRDCYMAWKRTGVVYSYDRLENQLSESRLKKIVAHE